MGLTPVLAEMARRYPRLTVEVITDDALTTWWRKASISACVSAR